MSDLLSFLNLARTKVLRSRTSNYHLNLNNQYKRSRLFRRRERVQVAERPHGQLQKTGLFLRNFPDVELLLDAPTVGR
jgi:hypothetical protein